MKLFDDDFNSSDIEIEEQPDPHAHRGMKSINAMKKTAFEDRVQSKRDSKSLKHISGAPDTQITRNTWLNRFDAFRDFTLKKTSVFPTCHLFRSSMLILFIGQS